jgi:thiamine biosynthesis protein ThiI
MDLPLQILIRSPEITLKGRNQGEFWVSLKSNVSRYLASESLDWPVRTARARLYVEAGIDPCPNGLTRALNVLGNVAGVDSFAAARRLDRNRVLKDGALDRRAVEDVLVRLAEECCEPEKSFAIRAHRVDKRFPLTSSEMETWLGNAVRERTGWSRVDLERPHRTFFIDIYSEGLFFYAERHKGLGGLPVGASGRVLSLLSGGIDSPVASFLLSRRGASVDWFHVSAVSLTERDLDRSAIGRIARRLSRTSFRSRLYAVPYTHFDLALRGMETGYEPVLFRRFLFRAAEALAARIGALALVTGDSLAQVASQTLLNLIATTKVVDTLVLRPLVGMDKQQIMDLARRIGTYDLSIEPSKDCCALYARHAKTKTRNEALSAIEERLMPDYDALVERSLRDALWAEYECGELVSVHSSPLDFATPAPTVTARS